MPAKTGKTTFWWQKLAKTGLRRQKLAKTLSGGKNWQKNILVAKSGTNLFYRLLVSVLAWEWDYKV